MVNHGHLNVVHGQTRTTRLSPWSNMDTYMQSMVRTSKTITSMVFDGLGLHTSMDFDGCSWISMVDHQIPCSPWSFMVTISPGKLCSLLVPWVMEIVLQRNCTTKMSH